MFNYFMNSTVEFEQRWDRRRVYGEESSICAVAGLDLANQLAEMSLRRSQSSLAV